MGKLRSLQQALTEETIAGGSERLPETVIKSAGRALQILELFDILQRRATVTEISELLGYPQSSTTMLLRSLVAMGYLNYEIRGRTYVTSSRVALLGKWAGSTLITDGHVIQVMRRINERCGQTVVLAVRSGMMTQYIHVVQATAAVRLYVVQGSVRPLLKSGTGLALLSELSDVEIRRLIMRTNADGGIQGELIRDRDVFRQVQQVRELGYALTVGILTPDAGVVAMPLPEELTTDIGQSAAIAIGAASSVLLEQRDFLIGVLKEEVDAASRALAARQEMTMPPSTDSVTPVI